MDEIEKKARELLATELGAFPGSCTREVVVTSALRAIAAALRSAQAPDGWVLVPREPTDAMLDAMHGRIRILCNPAERTADIQNDAEVWAAMIAAAPSAEGVPHA